MDVFALPDIDRIAARFVALGFQPLDGRLQPPRADIDRGEAPSFRSEAFRDRNALSHALRPSPRKRDP